MARYFFILGIFLLAGCKYDHLENADSCIATLIDKLKNETDCESKANLSEYRFQGKLVYVPNPGFCANDQSFVVMDADCQILGYLSGFAGNKMINGEDFSKNAEFLREVWSE